MDLYKALKDAGCEIDSHESDLYVRLTEESVELVRLYALTPSHVTRFINQVDGNVWLDVPFSFTPFWEHRINRSKSI